MVINQLDLQARLIRRTLRRARIQRQFPQQAVEGIPILFANSFPKSGTHLLTQILRGFEQLGPFVDSGFPPVRTFDGESGKARSIAKIQKEINRFHPGDIGYGHVHARPEHVDLLCEDGMAAFFIYRDPRDVLVSHVHYVTEINTRHVHHDYYFNELSSFEERLSTSISGRPDVENPFPNIRERFEPYLDWLPRGEILSLRFEELIDSPFLALGRILKHVIDRGFAYIGNQEKAIRILEGSIDPNKSPTFRSGKIGAWKESFSQAHKELFKKLSGDLLLRLGYEENHNW